jgi:hypothetical protein
MQRIRIDIVGAFISFITMNVSYGDTLVYQCKMKNGHINFTDQPCKTNEKEKSRKIIKNLAMTHSVQPKPIPDDPIVKQGAPQQPQVVYVYPPKQKRIIRQEGFDLGYPGYGYYPYPPTSLPNTYSSTPLFKPPLAFNPPLTVQPPSR